MVQALRILEEKICALRIPEKKMLSFERSSTNLPCVTSPAPSVSQEDKQEARTFSRKNINKKKGTTATTI